MKVSIYISMNKLKIERWTMLIKEYLFIGSKTIKPYLHIIRTKINGSKFYYKLSDGLNDAKKIFDLWPFVYEVELDPEDIFNVSFYYLEANQI